MKRNRRATIPKSGWRRSAYIIIFEAETPLGKAFDVGLILAIIASVAIVMLDSVEEYHIQFTEIFFGIEIVFTIFFTIEYMMRIICTEKPLRYIFSFFGIIDLLAILPTYISFLFPSSQYLIVVRVLRVMRVFRILKLVEYVGEAEMLWNAVVNSSRKITVFLVAVSAIVIIVGALEYLIEGPENGFTSIPRSCYWAVVTLTTVGYGTIVPVTPLGQALAAVIMLLGYGMIAVPTGIVSAEITQAFRAGARSRVCNQCESSDHENDAVYCRICGERLVLTYNKESLKDESKDTKT